MHKLQYTKRKTKLVHWMYCTYKLLYIFIYLYYLLFPDYSTAEWVEWWKSITHRVWDVQDAGCMTSDWCSKVTRIITYQHKVKNMSHYYAYKLHNHKQWCQPKILGRSAYAPLIEKLIVSAKLVFTKTL